MLAAALPSLLALIQALLPSLSVASASSATIAAVITALEAWVPLIIKEAPVLISTVQDIITTLSSSDAITDDQLAQLEAISAQVDAAFDVAAAAATAEDAAKPGT